MQLYTIKSADSYGLKNGIQVEKVSEEEDSEGTIITCKLLESSGAYKAGDLIDFAPYELEKI